MAKTTAKAKPRSRATKGNGREPEPYIIDHLLPLPAGGRLSRKAALGWLRNDLPGFLEVLGSVCNLADNRAERVAATLLQIDLGVAIRACVAALETGAEQTIRHAAPAHDVDFVGDTRSLALLMHTRRLYTPAGFAGGIYEGGYEALGAELVRRLELLENVDAGAEVRRLHSVRKAAIDALTSPNPRAVVEVA